MPSDDRNPMSHQVIPVPKVTEEAKRHARLVVTEHVFGLRDTGASATPEADLLEILGCLGILPDQPPPRINEKWPYGRWAHGSPARSSHSAAKADGTDGDT